MSIKAPEISSAFGTIDDNALADGSPLSSHVVREIGRQGNRLQARVGDVAFRWLGASDTTNAAYGDAKLYVSPTWHHMFPFASIPIRKKAGQTKLRCRIRAGITEGHVVRLYVRTSVTTAPGNQGAGSILFMTGAAAGAVTAYTISDIPCGRGPNEVVAFYLYRRPAPATDTLMNTATYGTPNTGTCSTNFGRDRQIASTGAAPTWTGVHNGGHYVHFKSPVSGETVMFSRVTGTPSNTSLEVYPFPPQIQTGGLDFEIYQMTTMRIVSVALYPQEATE